MASIKYESGWDFEMFLYKNYGFSHTSNDRSVAFSQYVNLCRKHNDKLLL